MIAVVTSGALGALGACGPVAYVNQVTRSSADAIDAARDAEAEKYAPYYWTRAIEYRYKAKQRAAKADFQGANRFGRLATEAAEVAAQEAVAVKKDPSKGPLDVKKRAAPDAPAEAPPP